MVGLALSAFLGWHYLMGGEMIGCGVGNACDQVLNSRWSAIGGVLPVSGLAAGAYLAMLTASLFIGPATEAPVRRLAWRAMLVLAGAAAGSAVWFIIVQKWIVGAFCPYCMATHVTGLLLGTLTVWQAPKQLDHAVSLERRGAGFLPVYGLVLLGVFLAGVMAVCQIHFKPPAVYRGGEFQNSQPVLDPRDVPLIGSPDASYLVNVLFDYNCPHCQELHFMLDEVVRRYRGKLAFVLCPTPLNSHCNPYVPVDVDEFKTSCELTQIALAVWVAKREEFPAFNRWMFTFGIRRPLAVSESRRRQGQGGRIGWPGEVRCRHGRSLDWPLYANLRSNLWRHRPERQQPQAGQRRS